VPLQHGAYIDFHLRIVEAVESVIHVKAVKSIDEMVCDLMGSAREEVRAREISMDVKAAISSKVGESLRYHIGMAPNDYLTKTASDMNMHQRLWRKGVFSVEQLCRSPKEKLRDIWGGIEGERSWLSLHGESKPFRCQCLLIQAHHGSN